MNLNKVLLIGNLTRDPELRYTPSGQAVCNLGVAVNRAWTDKKGEKQKETTFLRVVVWGKTAESCAEYLKKGRGVFIDGRLQSRSWEKDGEKRTELEVVADKVDFMPDGRGGQGDGGQRRPANTGAATRHEENASYGDHGSEDDIPF